VLGRPDNLITGNTGYAYEVYGNDPQEVFIKKMVMRIKLAYAGTGEKIDDDTARKMAYDYMNPPMLNKNKKRKLTRKEKYQLKIKEYNEACQRYIQAVNSEWMPITREMFMAALDRAQFINDKNRFKGHTVAQYLNEDIGVLLRDLWEEKHLTSYTNRNLSGTYDSYYYSVTLARYKMEHDPEACKQDPYAMALLTDDRYKDGFDLSKYVFPGEQFEKAPIGPDGKPVGTFNNARLGWSTEECVKRKQAFMDHVRKRAYEAQLIKAQKRAKKAAQHG
jgi:hypothetical protein